MIIGILKEGDHVINVSSEFIAVERKSGEVDIISIFKDGETLRVDPESIVTIGYGDNIVQKKSGGMTITTF